MSNSPTILLVDDTPDILLVMGDLLECMGYTVLYAENGESAIQRTLTTTPDLILLDIQMPGLDGYATCQTLKTLAALRDVPRPLYEYLLGSASLAAHTRRGRK